MKKDAKEMREQIKGQYPENNPEQRVEEIGLVHPEGLSPSSLPCQTSQGFHQDQVAH